MIPITNHHLSVSVVMKFTLHGVKPISLLHIPKKTWTALNRAKKQRLMEQQTTIDQFAFLLATAQGVTTID